MTVGSPSAYLLWAILSCIFLVFLVVHLWAYDRFACLRWDAGRQPGAFKRVMTYSYLGTVPLLVVFSVAMTAIKFSEGYYATSSGRIISKPLVLWQSKNRLWLLPLYFLLSIAWSLELVTHLEELSFWLFLLHQRPGKREWFYSWEFRAWYTGSIVAVLGMPLTTLLTRRNLETCQAYIFLVGSSAGTSTTLCFLYVLLRFPAFIKHVKAEGAEPDVVVRLATFYQLNLIRVTFRFLFTIPLLIIAIDALHRPYTVIHSPFALDFLLMIGGIGCFISSAITLLIFFPRSFTREAGYKARMHTPQNSGKVPSATVSVPHYDHDFQDATYTPKPYDMDFPPCSRVHSGNFQFPDQTHPQTAYDHPLDQSPSQLPHSRPSLQSTVSHGYESDESEAMTSHTMPVTPARCEWHAGPSLARDHISEQGGEIPAHPISTHNRRLNVRTTISLPPRPRPVVRESFQLHPYVLHFTSPIDLLDLSETDRVRGSSRAEDPYTTHN